MNTFLTAAALAISAITVHAQDDGCGMPSTAGQAAVVNRCSYPVAMWSVADESTPMLILDGSQPGYKEEFRFKTGCGGPSLKIAPFEDGMTGIPEKIAQFEYTANPGMDLVFFDLSYVNGQPFNNSPVVIQPSDPSCPVVNCANNDEACLQAYNKWNDDTATKACGLSSELIFTLCPDNAASDNSSSTSSSGDSSSNPAPASSASSSGNPVVVGANGLLGEGSPQPATSSSSTQGTTNAPSTSASSSLTGDISIAALDIANWLGPQSGASSYPSKRAAEAEAETVAVVGKRHVHDHVQAHSHEKLRRSRVFRHLH